MREGEPTMADEDAFVVAEVPHDARDIRCQFLLGVLLETLDKGRAADFAATDQNVITEISQ